MKEKLRKIYKYFGGYEHQKDKLAEECHEYLGSGRNDEAAEIADLWVVAEQLRLHSPVIQNLIEHKIDRTLTRIKEGYYEGV